jgi:Multicopper oxidase
MSVKGLLRLYSQAEGVGTWDGTIVRPSNPQRRDTQQVRPNGYMVWQANADNPGAWPLHCHIAWHLSSGMAITIVERPDDIVNVPIPPASYQQCRDWRSWKTAGVLPQIDSGV